MTRMRKTITTALATAAMGGALLAATSTPAAAWGGYGWHHGWGGPGLAAGVIGGLALGAIAAGSYDGGYGCVASAPAYGPYGNFIGYRRVRVAC